MADILISKFTTQIPRVGATPATPGFAESEGQDPVSPSGTPLVYTPVTIGTPANGLSIDASQVLSIGLASTSATGALSSTDWNTFNNKLNLTSPITGYTVGANTALAATDTILEAFGKVQGQINVRISGTIASGQVAFGSGVNTISGNNNLAWNNSTNRLTVTGNLVVTGFYGGTSFTDLNTPQSTQSSIRILSAGFQPANRPSGNFFVGLEFTSLETNNGYKGQLGVGSTGNESNLFYRSADSVGTWSAWRNVLIASANTAGQMPFGGGGSIVSWTSNIFWDNTNSRFGVLTTSPTNTLDVNGTTRIRTISNLGSAATSVLVPSATGVVSLRTLAEFVSDGGLITGLGVSGRVSFWNGTNTQTSDSDFLWNDSLNRLTIGSSSNAVVGTPNIFLGRDNNSETSIQISNSTSGTSGSVTVRLSGAGARNTTFGEYSALHSLTELRNKFVIDINNISPHSFAIFLNSNTALFEIYGGGRASTDKNLTLFSNGNLLLQKGGTHSDNGFRLDVNGTLRVQGNQTLTDGSNFIFATTTGTKIGTATNQKIGFYNATPIVQPSGDILTALSNLGLVASPTITQVDQFSVKTTATADQTLPSGTLTILDYDSTLVNNSTATYTVGTDGRITINTTGIYTITAGVVIEADAVTALESAFLGIFRNGDLVAISSINTTIAAGAQSGLSTSTILSLTATDIIDCRALVNSVGGVANGLARRLGTLLGANATQVNSLSITKNSM